MSRHKSRLDRLTRGMGASAEHFESARLDRMTDEELLAVVVVEAVKAGFDAEVARMNPAAAIAWVDAEGDRLTALAVEAGFDPEVARKDRVAAVRRCGGTRSVDAAKGSSLSSMEIEYVFAVRHEAHRSTLPSKAWRSLSHATAANKMPLPNDGRANPSPRGTGRQTEG